MVRTQYIHSGVLGSTPGQGTKILQAVCSAAGKKKKFYSGISIIATSDSILEHKF